VVAGLHDGDFELLGPDLSGPVTNSQEILEMDGVTLHGIDGTVMLSLLVSEPPDALSFLVSVLAIEGETLLRSNQEFVGMRVLVIVEASTAIDFALWVVSVAEDELVSGGVEHTHVPPEDASVR